MSDPSIAEGLGYLAALLTLGVFYMKTMIPLRIAGIMADNVFPVRTLFLEIRPTRSNPRHP